MKNRTLSPNPETHKTSWTTDATFRFAEHLAEWRRLGGIPAPCSVCGETTSSLVFRPDSCIGKLVVLHGVVLCRHCVRKAASMKRVIYAADSVGAEFLIVHGLQPVEPWEAN